MQWRTTASSFADEVQECIWFSLKAANIKHPTFLLILQFPSRRPWEAKEQKMLQLIVISLTTSQYAPGPYVEEKLAPQSFSYEYGVADDYSKANFKKTETQDASGNVQGSFRPPPTRRTMSTGSSRRWPTPGSQSTLQSPLEVTAMQLLWLSTRRLHTMAEYNHMWLLRTNQHNVTLSNGTFEINFEAIYSHK